MRANDDHIFAEYRGRVAVVTKTHVASLYMRMEDTDEQVTITRAIGNWTVVG